MTSHAARYGLEARAPVATSGRRAAVAITASVVLWFAVEIVAGGVFRSVTAWQVVFVRYTIHLAIVLAIWGRQAPWRTQRRGYHLARSALMLVMPGAFVLGVSQVDAAPWVNTMFWSAPLLVLVFAALIDGERPASTTWAAASFALVSGWLYFAPEGVPSIAAIVYGLAMAASFALYLPMTRRLRDEPLRTNLFYTAVVPWLALMPLMPRVWVTPATPESFSLLFIGSAGLIALLALDRAAEAAPVSRSAPLLQLQIGLTMSFSLVAHGYPSPRRSAAIAVLLVAAAALGWPALRRDAEEVVA